MTGLLSDLIEFARKQRSLQSIYQALHARSKRPTAECCMPPIVAARSLFACAAGGEPRSPPRSFRTLVRAARNDTSSGIDLLVRLSAPPQQMAGSRTRSVDRSEADRFRRWAVRTVGTKQADLAALRGWHTAGWPVPQLPTPRSQEKPPVDLVCLPALPEPRYPTHRVLSRVFPERFSPHTDPTNCAGWRTYASRRRYGQRAARRVHTPTAFRGASG